MSTFFIVPALAAAVAVFWSKANEKMSFFWTRVRRLNDDGSSEEVNLSTYKAARAPSQLQESIVTAPMHGVSTRDVENIKPKSPGVGRLNVTRHWQSGEHKFVDEL